jgi:hypothetical protein
MKMKLQETLEIKRCFAITHSLIHYRKQSLWLHKCVEDTITGLQSYIAKEKFVFFYTLQHHRPRSRVSSGSIVSDYRLDDRAIGVRSPAGAEDFSSSLYVQTGSGAHPASCRIGTGGPFPGGKARLGRDADHLPPSSAEVVNE